MKNYYLFDNSFAIYPDWVQFKDSLGSKYLIYLVPMLTAISGAKKAIDIGVGDGWSSVMLAACLDKNGHLTCIDNDKDLLESAKNKVIKLNPELKLNCIYDTSLNLKNLLPDEMFDICLIDGCHDYDYVFSDLNYCYFHTKAGGFIFLHDYGTAPQVTIAVDDFIYKYDLNHKLIIPPNNSTYDCGGLILQKW
jgi:hypothetical protein